MIQLNDEQLMLRDSVRKVMEKIATPEYMRRLDRDKVYPTELFEAWVEAGIFAVPFPEEYGGINGSVTDLAIVAEEIARTSADFVMAFAGPVFCGLTLLKNASESQKGYWLPRLIEGKCKMSISISEPDAGSDVGALRTTATKDGEYWVINGQKTWQTGAGAANNVMNVYARTNRAAHYRQGLSLFLVDKDTPGVTMRKLDMLGRWCVGTYEVFFDDVRVPADRLVGRENEGWSILLSGLQVERVVVAACDCGSALGVVDLAIDYAKERKQFGRAIGSFQSIAHAIADMMTDVEAARALMWQAACLADSDKDALREISMAKLFASEVYSKVSNMGMQVFGGNGYSMEYPMQRHYRDSRVATIAAGTSQILRNVIAASTGLRSQ